MCRTKSLILLLLCASIAACGYSFVLDGKYSTQKFVLAPSKNDTSLINAGMTFDAELEKTLSSMGMLARGGTDYTLRTTLVSSSVQAITSTSLSTKDRYRLTLGATATVMDAQGKEAWKMSFSGTGTFAERGQAEDALGEASRRVSLEIARALASLTL